MRRPTGCSAHRTSKSPLQVNVPLLAVVTFSTQTGLTSQTHARLGLQSTSWMISLVAVDQFPSCCGSHTRDRDHFSVMADYPQGMGRGSEERGFLYKREFTIIAHIGTISRKLKTLKTTLDNKERENRQSQAPLSCSSYKEHRLLHFSFFK